jgi:hypothetical protein
MDILGDIRPCIQAWKLNTAMNDRSARLFRCALWLGYITVFYNLLEGLVFILFGATDDALTLLGFGVGFRITFPLPAGVPLATVA